VIKIGEVYEVPLDESSKKYFQIVAFDSTQLSSSVVRAFKTAYTLSEKTAIVDIIRDDVQFYAHCSVRLGVKLSFWKKAGNITDVGELGHIIFRGTSDYGHKLGEEPIRISEKWYIWKINDEKFMRVGKLTSKYQDAEIGIVVTSGDIVQRMRAGEYNFIYPGY
jgi:hypothetical protein